MSSHTLSAFLVSSVLPLACAWAGSGAELPKKVYADYFPNHGTREFDGNWGTWQRSMVAAESNAKKTYFNYNPDLIDADGRRQIAATVYPLVGVQSDIDPFYLEYQILQAKTAHIDGFLVEWALSGAIRSDVALKALVEMARRYDFEIGVDWIDKSFFDWIPHHREDCDTREKQLAEFERCLQYLLDTVYNAESAVLVDGHPLILLFGGGLTTEELQAIRASDLRPSPLFVRRAGIGPERVHTDNAYENWASVVDGSFAWLGGRFRLSGKPIPEGMLDTYDHYADGDDQVAYQQVVREKNHEYFEAGSYALRMSSACPGFDNRGCSGWGSSLALVPRDEGETYRRQWEANVRNRERIDAVLLVTWNDYTEATSVEPTVEHGLREIEVTERYAAAFKGIPSAPSGTSLPVRLFQLRTHSRFLERTGCQTDALASQLDRAATLISEGHCNEGATALQEAERIAASLAAPITEHVVTVAYPGDQIEATAPVTEIDGASDLARPFGLRFEDELAERLRTHNFEGFLEFDYLDEDDQQFWVLTDPARPDVRSKAHVARLYSEVCRIKKDDTGKWVSARVEVYKVNSAFMHRLPTGADFAFGGQGTIRNIRFTFTLFELEGA